MVARLKLGNGAFVFARIYLVMCIPKFYEGIVRPFVESFSLRDLR